jgi:tRNA threonylcarbamoyladenosine biosynthesis protein TsaE
VGANTEVPSPTFTLVQTYEAASFEIWHADLYRLNDPQEVVELGLVDAFEDSVCLIEWPDLLGELVPETALQIELSVDGDGRVATLTYGPDWNDRMATLEDA